MRRRETPTNVTVTTTTPDNSGRNAALIGGAVAVGAIGLAAVVYLAARK